MRKHLWGLVAALIIGGMAFAAYGAQVNLSWSPSTDNAGGSGVAGYNVLRSMVSGGQYATIGRSTAASYADNTAASGATYYYVVQSYDGAGNVSGNSNQVVAVIPPATPTSTTTSTPPAFAIGDRVRTIGNVNVRGTPSVSGALLGTQQNGALGTVAEGPQGADGFLWWRVDYDAAPDGWSAEQYLQKTSTAGALCGNGVIDAGEWCDGADLGGRSCVSIGLRSGALRCAANCVYDFSACTASTTIVAQCNALEVSLNRSMQNIVTYVLNQQVAQDAYVSRAITYWQSKYNSERAAAEALAASTVKSAVYYELRATTDAKRQAAAAWRAALAVVADARKLATLNALDAFYARIFANLNARKAGIVDALVLRQAAVQRAVSQAAIDCRAAGSRAASIVFSAASLESYRTYLAATRATSVQYSAEYRALLAAKTAALAKANEDYREAYAPAYAAFRAAYYAR